MNSIILITSGIFFYILGYFLYSKFIERRLVFPLDKRKTPAYSMRDGVDYEPAKPIILFGHHFSSIAGAGPIIGPVIACYYFGWAPAFVWLVIGCIFFGAVHDYLSLILSIRHKGKSISQISSHYLSKIAFFSFTVFLWLALILVIAVFASGGARTFIEKPQVIIPSFGLIPVAMIFGFFIYRKGFSASYGTVIAVAVLFGLLWLGYVYPLRSNFSHAFEIFFIILVIYGTVASLLPVWFLLQPRDYLSTAILFIGMLLGMTGIFFSHKAILYPAYKGLSTQAGTLWPMLFILIACGAISGFHALVSSGTTSKQIDMEKNARPIGYGGMLTEGLLAIIALAAVSAGLSVKTFSEFMSGKKGWLISFCAGYGNLTSGIPGISAEFGTSFAMIMLNTFILTTLDTCIRLSRFIITEIFGEYFGLLKNKFFVTILNVSLATYLGLTGGYQKLWPIFGACNQLIAALTLIIISLFFFSNSKPIKFTMGPAIFMMVTTVWALVLKFKDFFSQRNYLLAGVDIFLLILALVVIIESFRMFLGGKTRGSEKISINS